MTKPREYWSFRDVLPKGAARDVLIWNATTEAWEPRQLAPGAYSSDNTFTTDFEEYGAPVDLLTQDWTQRWDNLGSSLNTVDTATADNIIASYQGASGSGLNELLSWDDPGTPTNVEVIFETEVVGTGAQLITVVRAAAASASVADGYGVTLNVANNALRIQRVLDGAVTFQLFQQPLGVTLADGQRWIIKFRVNGTSIMARAWQSADPEPATWLIDGADSSISAAGWVGLNSFWFDTPFPIYSFSVEIL